jgi:hypothetical protein
MSDTFIIEGSHRAVRTTADSGKRAVETIALGGEKVSGVRRETR